jgi:hypothetical protein
MSDAIAAVFDVEPHDVTVNVDPISVSTVDDTEDEDFNIARMNQLEFLEMGKAALNTGLRIAGESENPRAIEVLSGLLKNVADMNQQLLKLSREKVDIKAARNNAKGPVGQPVQQIGTQQNVTLVGSSADLNKMLADRLAAK